MRSIIVGRVKEFCSRLSEVEFLDDKSIEELASSSMNDLIVKSLTEHHIDVSDSSFQEMKNILLETKKLGEICIVYWPSFRDGIIMGYRLFVENLDHLWYPSADDLLIISKCEDSVSIIYINHEEEVTIVEHSISEIQMILNESLKSIS